MNEFCLLSILSSLKVVKGEMEDYRWTLNVTLWMNEHVKLHVVTVTVSYGKPNGRASKHLISDWPTLAGWWGLLTAHCYQIKYQNYNIVSSVICGSAWIPYCTVSSQKGTRYVVFFLTLLIIYWQVIGFLDTSTNIYDAPSRWTRIRRVKMLYGHGPPITTHDNSIHESDGSLPSSIGVFY